MSHNHGRKALRSLTANSQSGLPRAHLSCQRSPSAPVIAGEAMNLLRAEAIDENEVPKGAQKRHQRYEYGENYECSIKGIMPIKLIEEQSKFISIMF